MTKRQKDKKTKRQGPKGEFNVATSGQFRTLAMFFKGMIQEKAKQVSVDHPTQPIIYIQQQCQPPGCQEDGGRAQVHHVLEYENTNQSEEAFSHRCSSPLRGFHPWSHDWNHCLQGPKILKSRISESPVHPKTRIQE